MSHGGGSDEKCEPNLVPMLDMVLQLVMFFIMVANFSMQEHNSDVALPTSESAKPQDKHENETLYLNLNNEGKLVVPGRELPLSTVAEIGSYLKHEYKDFEEAAKAKGDSSGKVKAVIIIRADKNADFAPIFNVLREAKQAGFKKWELRANIQHAAS